MFHMDICEHLFDKKYSKNCCEIVLQFTITVFDFNIFENENYVFL